MRRPAVDEGGTEHRNTVSIAPILINETEAKNLLICSFFILSHGENGSRCLIVNCHDYLMKQGAEMRFVSKTLAEDR